MVEQVQASDADTGDNARVSYLIESGAFEHFEIDVKTGAVDVAAKLDFDRKPQYKIQILAVDSGQFAPLHTQYHVNELISYA
jgi:Cadherin domain